MIVFTNLKMISIFKILQSLIFYFANALRNTKFDIFSHPFNANPTKWVGC